MSEIPVLVCMRVADLAPENIALGCQVRQCRTCGIDVWASPASLRVIAEREGHIMCVPCALPLMSSDDTVEFTEEQREEVREHFRRKRHDT